MDVRQANMDKEHNTRNASVIAPVGHGRSTLIDSLMAAVGTTTNFATGVSINYKEERDGNTYTINLIDPPALRITDGAMLVVDFVEGVGPQTEALLRPALAERVRPVLTVNKIDRCFLQLRLEDGEQAYQALRRVVDGANVILARHRDPLLGDVRVCPGKGTVAFSAGLHGWGFTLASFARTYASKYRVEEAQMMEWLWGDHFYDCLTMEWTREHTGSNSCIRGFVRFCYQPIWRMIDVCMTNQKEWLHRILKCVGVTVKAEDVEDLMGEALMKRVMQSWLPASDALLGMMAHHLPSPVQAKRYRHRVVGRVGPVIIE